MGRSIRRLVQAVRGGRGFRAFAYFVLCAFVFQGFITHRHMHWNGLANGLAADAIHIENGVVLSDLSAPASKQLPAGHDESKCPIYHAAAVAGCFLVATAPILRIPPLSTLALRRDERSIVVERFTAAWRSRAPPSV